MLTTQEIDKTLDGIEWKFRDGSFTQKEKAIIILALERLK